METVERLQARLAEGERALGDLIKDSLRISRAIEQRRAQNKRDKGELAAAKTRAQSNTDALAYVLHELRDVSKTT